MLVLSRKTGEQIVIGENIRITVIRIQGDKVRIGIEAPPDVKVYRSELLEQDHDHTAPGAATEAAPGVAAPALA